MYKNVKITLDDGVETPFYATEQAVGFDLRCYKILAAYKGDQPVKENKLEQMKNGFIDRGYIKMRAFERILFGTGISVQLPEDVELQIRPRSGAVLKKGITVLNSPGTIDPDYRGEIGLILYNASPFMTEVKFQERMAQGVLNKIQIAVFEKSETLSQTDRGEGGFGSTGN